ncbi:MAG: PSD1 and planctomycete cytochrome C domain-containing protein [Planctomycetaceae bacterium]
MSIIWFALLLLMMTGREVNGVDFATDVAVILETHCIRCHQPGNAKGDVSLATRDGLFAQGHVIAGDAEGSYLLELVTGTADAPPAMPKEGAPLAEKEVEVLREWIAAGASWPEGLVIREQPKADATWWAFQPLLQDFGPEWSSIDDFVGAKLAEAGLAPNQPADRRTLIRRATYDLTGLPPTPEEVAAFIADPDPLAYEKLVDRLLASPHYGERWGRHWLDVVRFGESIGYERNVIVNDIWPFRDYVIRSLNEDKPFDQFIREQIAGDVIAADDPRIAVGSAFLVAGPYDDVGNQDAAQAAQIRANTMDEIIRASSEAFLGVTLGCARCHDHKFDPLTQADYYALYATFSGVRHGSVPLATPAAHAERAAKLAPLNQRKQELEQTIAAPEAATRDPAEQQRLMEELANVNREIATVPGLPHVWIGRRSQGDAAGPFHVFLGGSPQKRGDAVTPASLSVFNDIAARDGASADGHSNGFGYQLPAEAPEAERRAAFANWLVHPKNPLTPRVLANRLWHYHFGTGIVDTPSDFGYMGGRPTHPELLDFLATQLIEQGWRIKPIHRMIMLSETYRQSSNHREDAARTDADARLLWRFPPRRLSAEEVRDTLLVVAGKLSVDHTRPGDDVAASSSDPLVPNGGPGFRLYQHLQDNVCTYIPLDTHGPETYRRAVYHQNVRASVVDLMTDFDQPDCAFSTTHRAETTTPLQALTMLNHSFTLDMANSLAERLQRELGDDVDARLRRVWQLCFSRDPNESELASCRQLATTHGMTALCRVLLNTSELLYVE